VNNEDVEKENIGWSADGEVAGLSTVVRAGIIEMRW
jgi:hypothetical protein